MIIDVDTHWETDGLDPSDHPLAPWADRFPDSAEFLADAIAGDLLRALGRAERPDGRTLLPGLVKLSNEHFKDGELHLQPIHHSDAGERVAWMDRIGIDHCLVNPGGYWLLLQCLPSADLPEGVRRCNDFLTAQLGPHSDRLHAVANVALDDLDEAVCELERVRRRGARAFFVYTVNGQPPTVEAFGHPAWDKVWRASVALGMVPILHVGNIATDFTRWANVGWKEPDGSGVEGLVRIANTQRVHGTQNIISSLLYGGSFARVPEMAVLVAEMRAGWLPWFVRMLEFQGLSSPPLGEWPYQASAGEMLRHNVRLTPLPGFGDTDALEVLAQLPEMCVFSSDFPHGEGNPDPINLYGNALIDLDPGLRDSFLGGNMFDVFARMGQPLGQS